MGLVLFDGIAVSNTLPAPPVTLTVDPAYLVAGAPEIRTLAGAPEIRMIKG